jgi:hypothetical protein
MNSETLSIVVALANVALAPMIICVLIVTDKYIKQSRTCETMGW